MRLLPRHVLQLLPRQLLRPSKRGLMQRISIESHVMRLLPRHVLQLLPRQGLRPSKRGLMQPCEGCRFVARAAAARPLAAIRHSTFCPADPAVCPPYRQSGLCLPRPLASSCSPAFPAAGQLSGRRRSLRRRRSCLGLPSLPSSEIL